MFKRFILAAAIAGAAFSASALQVRPLYSEFPAAHKSGVLTIYNTDATEKTYQVIVEAWTLKDGQKVRTPSKDIRMAPSIMTIKPKGSQVVRYVYSGQVDQEAAYRVAVQEIPSSIKPEKSGVSYTMRMDAPWFWRAAETKPQLSARWEGGDLLVKNAGTATAQLVNLDAGGVQKQGLVGYVLPGEEHRLTLKAKAKTGVSVVVNGQAVKLDAK